MTLLDIIRKLAGPAADLTAFLSAAGAKYPDLEPRASDLAAKLSTAVSADSLVTLASELPKEIADILQGKLDGRRHPSDVA